MVLMVFFSSRISPRTSTVILRERSPLATAVVTSAMFRTWAVRLQAMEFTESVRSFHVPATPLTSAWPPSLPSVPTSRATRVTSRRERVELAHHGVHHFGGTQELTFQRPSVHLQRHRLGQIALGDRADDAGDLGRGLHQIGDETVDASIRRPCAAHVAEAGTLVDFPLLADRAADSVELVPHALVQLDDFI